jgi:hypothetical protein
MTKFRQFYPGMKHADRQTDTQPPPLYVQFIQLIQRTHSNTVITLFCSEVDSYKVYRAT